jgi:hypothetical protein
MEKPVYRVGVTALGSLCLPLFASAGEVRVITSPPGAEVWSKGIRQGVTGDDGLTLPTVAPGELAIRIAKPGYTDVERLITVPDTDEVLTVFVQLLPAAPAGGAVSERPGQRTQDPGGSSVARKPAKRRSRTGLIVGAVAGAAAVGGGVALLSKKDPLEVDDDRDGFSEKSGDCNDNDPQISPNGRFSVDLTTGVRGSINCNTPWGSLEVVATNLSCTVISISRVTSTDAFVSGTCRSTIDTDDLSVVASSVSPGARGQTVARASYSGTVGCCTGGNCPRPGASCSYRQTVTIVASNGQHTLTNNYSIEFPGGRSCPPCSGSAALGRKAPLVQE